MVPNALPAGPVSLRLRDHFLRPRVVREHFEDIAQGLVNGSGEAVGVNSLQSDDNPARSVDQFVSEEVSSFDVKQ